TNCRPQPNEELPDPSFAADADHAAVEVVRHAKAIENLESRTVGHGGLVERDQILGDAQIIGEIEITVAHEKIEPPARVAPQVVNEVHSAADHGRARIHA